MNRRRSRRAKSNMKLYLTHPSIGTKAFELRNLSAGGACVTTGSVTLQRTTPLHVCLVAEIAPTVTRLYRLKAVVAHVSDSMMGLQFCGSALGPGIARRKPPQTHTYPLAENKRRS